jgi:hypothetical protein
MPAAKKGALPIWEEPLSLDGPLMKNNFEKTYSYVLAFLNPELREGWKGIHVGPVLPERAPSAWPRSTAARRPTWVSYLEKKNKRAV